MNIEYQQGVFSRFTIFNFFRNMFIFVLLSTCGLSLYSGTLFAVEGTPLEAVEGTSFDSFQMADDIAFPATKKIYIEAVEASFSRAWMKEFRRKTSRSYRDQTLQKYAETFRLHLGEILTSSGWIVVTSREDGVIKVNVKLLNIHINAPEVINTVHPLVLNIGSANLEVSIYDAGNQLALHIKDARVTGSPSDSYIESNKTINFVRFNKMFHGWANNLTVYLNMVSELSSTS